MMNLSQTKRPKLLMSAVMLCGLAGFLGGCNDAQQGALLGAGAGAIAGGVIGHNSGRHGGEGAAIGAGVGALTGYIIGNESDKAKHERYHHYHDRPY